MDRFNDVLTNAKKYIKNKKNIQLLIDAFNYADKMHENQVRKSGEPYVIHPVEVAYILTTLRAAPVTIAAGLLHDVLEDTSTTKEEMTHLFGEDVTSIVDGVTKISLLKYHTKEKALRATHQKMLIAMAKDMRVIIVKLADRLHNMRTLEHLPLDKQRKISKETLDLYAPLAHRLGMYRIKAEMEDICFKYLEPEEYERVYNLIEDKKHEREQYIDEMTYKLNDLFTKNRIKFEIKGRVKNTYSVYKKMITRNVDFEEIFDLMALRIIVDNIEECYHVLGLVHANFTPIPMRFKDYIAVPKPNMYQSLHTTIMVGQGTIFEIQIRTHEMDQIAEIGIAAHWAYKENLNRSKEQDQFELAEKLKWYSNLIEYSEEFNGEDEETEENEMLEAVRSDIFSANVYVFTPKGDVIALPNGATPLDFAYRIHTEVGNRTIGAKVNGKIVPLSYQLATGEVVEMMLQKVATGPKEDWLKIVKTTHAKHKIRGILNKRNRDYLIQKGIDEFERMSKTMNFDRELTDDLVRKYYEKSGFMDVDSLYFNIGKNTISAEGAINKIDERNIVKLDDDSLLEQYKETKKNAKRAKKSELGILVEGIENPQIKISNCCLPIAGDDIVGYVTKGMGIAIHRSNCSNLKRLDENRFVDVYWESNTDSKFYMANLKILSDNRKNIVADIINVINSTDLFIDNISASVTKDYKNLIKVKIGKIRNVEQLNRLKASLTRISDIYSIERVNK